MNFLEALSFLQKNPKKSIVLERYSEEARNRLQFYLDNNYFVIQDGDKLPKPKEISPDDFSSSWVIYEGFHPQRGSDLDEIKFLKSLETRLEDTLKLLRKYRTHKEES